jgi:hypothetical protein
MMAMLGAAAGVSWAASRILERVAAVTRSRVPMVTMVVGLGESCKTKLGGLVRAFFFFELDQQLIGANSAVSWVLVICGLKQKTKVDLR